MGFGFQVSGFMPRFIDSAVVFTLTTLVGGCAASPPARFYTLSAANIAATAPSNMSVLVGPVSVPAVVDRPEIVVSIGPNQVMLDDFNRWAAPLQNSIARVVADNLAALLGTPRVTLLTQTSLIETDFRAVIEVQSFQSAPGEAATLDALWSVRRMTDGKAEAGRTLAREAIQEKSYDALAAAHSRALRRLSQDIAAAVITLDRSAR